MAKNYDNYGYENNSYRSGGLSLVRRILIVLMVIVAILLIIYLLKGCNKSKKPIVPDNNDKVNFNYESSLLEAGKNYYSTHQDELPNSPGECSIVELETLLSKDLINADKFGSCNVNTTYVKVCKLENNTLHYTPWLTCVNKVSDSEYGNVKEGTNADIVENESYLDFKFMPQESTGTGQILGDVEEMWKEDIKYNSYKTLASTKYYRFRDKLYVWKLTNRNYFTSTGIKHRASDVTEYYTTSPDTGYRLYGDKTTAAYKWYKSSATKEYYKKDGVKAPSPVAVGDYTIKDPYGYDVTRYRTRTVTGTYSPIKYYGCSTSSSSNIIKYQQVPCGTGSTPEYKVTRETFYSCATDGDLIKTSPHVSSNATCKKYSAWSSLTSTKCNTNQSDICESYTLTFYYWYKIVSETRTYYPSGATRANAESVYFTSEPFKGAIKDTSTRATAYKWYNENTRYSTGYTATPPSGYTITSKTSDFTYSDWSNWSAKNPKVNDGRDREIQTKTKIKLQEIKGTTTSSWNNLSTDYLTEEALIKVFKDKCYKVSTLEDIMNNGQIKYELKLFIRNKKESK